MEILVPGPLAEVAANNPEECQRVLERVQDVIVRSFGEDGARMGRPPKLTQSEIARRVEMCRQILGVLRRDLDWSLPRSLDHLGLLLRAEIDGAPIDPTTLTTSWGVPGSERLGVIDLEGPDLAEDPDA